MKKLYLLLVSLICATTVVAQPTIEIDNTNCTGGQATINGTPVVRHNGMVNALLYGGSVRSFELIDIDLADTTKEPLVIWWLPYREHGEVCGTTVVVENPDALPTPTGSDPDPTIDPDDGESPYPCLSVEWISGNTSVEESFPPSLEKNQFENVEAVLFIEQCGMTLPSDINVDFSALSPPAQQLFHYGISCDYSPGTIPAGTAVDVYLVHYDPPGSNVTSTANLKFSREILGVVVTTSNLDASDSVLGNPGTLYGGTQRYLECAAATVDVVEISADMKEFSLDMRVTSGFEEVRIIVKGE